MAFRRSIRIASFLAISMTSAISTAVFAKVEIVLDSTTPGPTLLILVDTAPFNTKPTGVNDITAHVALEQVKNWTLTRGKIVTAPLAESTDAIAAAHPDALIVLRNVRSKDESSTLEIRGLDAPSLLDDLNSARDAKDEKITLAAGDKDLPAGVAEAMRISLVRKTGGITAAAETRIYRKAIFRALTAYQMTTSDYWTIIDPSDAHIRVALYAGLGSGASPGTSAYPKILETDSSVRYTFVGPSELTNPALMAKFNVLIFCGGMGNTQGAAIGKDGAAAVKTFIKNGGGYVSSCAGSYLATDGQGWSLGIADVNIIDYEHWDRGMGDVNIELTPEGKKILGGNDGEFLIHYANGPLLKPAEVTDLVPITTLAYYRGDMHKTAPGGVMPGTPAIIADTYGKGRVLCFSPHPEYTPGLENFVTRAVHWVAHQEVAATQSAQVADQQQK